MPQYVILYHETPPDYDRPSHWDFMLEDNGALRTWALSNEPRLGESTDAQSLDDHRIDFLQFEGELSRGRGIVRCVDRGLYEVLSVTGTRLVVRLKGERWQTVAELECVDGNQSWRLRLGNESA